MHCLSFRIFYLHFNHEERVQEIFFLRQLSHDEAARKVSVMPWHAAKEYRIHDD